LRSSEEHRAFLWRRPPGDQALGACEHTLGKKLRRNTPMYVGVADGSALSLHS
jgi:hypothetical protein